MSNCESLIVPFVNSFTTLIQYSSLVSIFFWPGAGSGLPPPTLTPLLNLAPTLAPPLTLTTSSTPPLGVVAPRALLPNPPAFSYGLLFAAPELTGTSIGSPKQVTPPVLLGKPALKVNERFLAISSRILKLQFTLSAFPGANLAGISMNGVSIKEICVLFTQQRPVFSGYQSVPMFWILNFLSQTPPALNRKLLAPVYLTLQRKVSSLTGFCLI